MNIYLENAGPYLFDLATGLERDPTSLEGWSCLLLPLLLSHERVPPTLDRDGIIAILEREMRDSEGSIIACPDDDVLVICQQRDHAKMEALALRISGIINGYTDPVEEHTIFDMRRDWRAVHGLLIDKARGHTPGLEIGQIGAHPQMLTSELNGLLMAFQQARLHRQARDPISILLVEDDAITQRITKNLLKDDYILYIASNANEALDLYLRHAPDLVFLDINLPDGNGLDLLDQFNRIDPDAYIVMFSGNDTLENITSALSGGAHGFVAKPFRKERIRHYITDVELAHMRNRGELM